nr:hypothetical protein [Tanacetum cinerariifolium]
MLKVSSWKGVIRFGKRGKLSPRFIGPLKVIERIRPVAYKLELPDKLRGIHDTFHVSNLKREVKRHKQSRIPIVKVRWNSRRGLEFTWKHEDFFRSKENGENDVDLMKWAQSIYRDEHKGFSFSQEDALAILKFHLKWDAPEQVDLTGDVPGATQEDLFGHDARPRPAKKTKSDAMASIGGSSASTQFGELMEQELHLKREAAERAFEAQAEKDRTLMRLEELSASTQFGELMEQELHLKWEAAERAFEAQAEKDRTLMRLEELRFLATITKDLDDDDAYWIKKQKRLIKNKMRNEFG